MSRIHDALTKAEQQKQPGSLAPAASGALPRVDTAGETADFSVQAAGLPASPLTNESPQYMGDFPVRPWNPDLSRLIFTDSFSGISDSSAAGEAGREQVYAIEQLRSLRSRVSQLHAKKPIRTILVSSALGGEGKTFVSANFALALARQKGKKVLLVDGDLRKPSLHQLFGAPAEPGLTEYLAGSAELADVIQGGVVENLWVMPGGTPVSNAAELLGNQRIPGLLERLAAVFDWIIVDSSPVLAVSDAVAISRACDAVLLVARAGITQYDNVQRAQHEFREARVLGLVLNGVAKPEHGAYYYAGYSYGYGKGKGKPNGRENLPQSHRGAEPIG
jgi:capsular exopolysaccharide synthesis family protein